MKSKRDAVIVAMGRSAIGDFGGCLKGLRAYEMGAQVIRGVLDQVPDFDPAQLEEIILGDCMQCSDEASTARTTLLAAGIPETVPGVTVQRQCASAMQALAQSVTAIRLGDADFMLAGGVESMSNAYYELPQARWGARMRHGQLIDSMWEKLHSGSNLLEGPGKGYIMGMTAENLALKYGITREEQDVIALRSHNNAEEAIRSGKFAQEIIPVKVPQRKGEPKLVDTDEHVRFGLTMEQLAKLPPAFAKGGTVTAANSSGINDGAAICLLTAREKAQEQNLPILAKIHTHTAAGCDPAYMGWGPVPATEKLLKKTGVNLADIELIELNEAFSAQYLACEQGLGFNRDIANVNGSGVSLGHPVGCTGARIVVSLVSEMRRRGSGLGLASLCVGGGMGMSMLVENE